MASLCSELHSLRYGFTAADPLGVIHQGSPLWVAENVVDYVRLLVEEVSGG